MLHFVSLIGLCIYIYISSYKIPSFGVKKEWPSKVVIPEMHEGIGDRKI